MNFSASRFTINTGTITNITGGDVINLNGGSLGGQNLTISNCAGSNAIFARGGVFNNINITLQNLTTTNTLNLTAMTMGLQNVTFDNTTNNQLNQTTSVIDGLTVINHVADVQTTINEGSMYINNMTSSVQPFTFSGRSTRFSFYNSNITGPWNVGAGQPFIRGFDSSIINTESNTISNGDQNYIIVSDGSSANIFSTNISSMLGQVLTASIVAGCALRDVTIDNQQTQCITVSSGELAMTRVVIAMNDSVSSVLSLTNCENYFNDLTIKGTYNNGIICSGANTFNFNTGLIDSPRGYGMLVATTMFDFNSLVVNSAAGDGIQIFSSSQGKLENVRGSGNGGFGINLGNRSGFHNVGGTNTITGSAGDVNVGNIGAQTWGNIDTGNIAFTNDFPPKDPSQFVSISL